MQRQNIPFLVRRRAVAVHAGRLRRQEVRYDSEPEMGSWDEFLQLVQRALPIDKQL